MESCCDHNNLMERCPNSFHPYFEFGLLIYVAFGLGKPMFWWWPNSKQDATSM
jgi:hypothetical protein